MRRLYYLLPDVDTAKRLVDELLLARIHEEHIHVIAKEGAALGDLPPGRLAQTSDLIPALEKGIALGGAAGTLAGLIAISLPPAGLVFGGGALLALGLSGAGVGALMSTMVGVSIPSSRLKQFQEVIDSGQLLMMVDVAKGKVDDVTTLVKEQCPAAVFEGPEPTIPAFP